MREEKDLLVKAEDYNSTSILLTFASGEQRVLDINHLFSIGNDPHLSDEIKQRWKIMYDKGDFFKYEISIGDLVFGGWVEIFAEDLKKQTIPFEIYRQSDEQSKKLFVHYGSKHFDMQRFVEARNRTVFDFKPYGGLWGSPVDTEHSWLTWCQENDFRVYSPDDCFYFRLDMPLNWITIHNQQEWNMLPKRTDAKEGFMVVDFEAVQKQGIGDGLPLYAIETAFADYDVYSDCFPGYDCDSVVVLKDVNLIENYDAKDSDHPLTLEDLLPIKFFKEIRENISVSCLVRSPDDKAYIYVEEPDAHYGFKILVACISDGRIVEIGGYSEAEARMLIDEISPYKEELEHILKQNRVLMVR
jgi:hypothetical protein